MNIKKYALCSAVAVFAFGYGCLAHGGYSWLASQLTPAETMAEEIAPIAVISADACEHNVPFEAPFVEDQPALPTIETNFVEDFNLTGEYYLDDSELSIAFADFEYLEIETHKWDSTNEEEGYWISIPPSGKLQTKRGYKFSSLMVSPTEIAFETVAIDGISYQFAGKVGQDLESEHESSTGDIYGKLTKLRNGKAIAFLNAVFWRGGC